MKKILSLILLVLLPIVASAYDAEINDIYYNFYNGEAYVTYRDKNYNSYSGNVVIPASVTYNGKTYAVTGINYSAFHNCRGLGYVTIPHSVTFIGQWAFCGCSALTSITIPNSVTHIDDYAFLGCRGLTSITIPNNVTRIGEQAFAGCSGWASITIPSSVEYIGWKAFSGCYFAADSCINYSTLYYYALTNINFGATICDKETNDGLLIKDNSVVKCRPWATSVTTGNSVTSIGDKAFYECTSLTSVAIGNSVKTIGESAFQGCSGLTSITIPNSVTSIGEYAFQGCRGLTSVTIGNSVTNIDKYAFEGCTSLASVTIPNSVTTIGAWAFYECSGLTSVTIGTGVTSIGGNAFAGCSKLTSVCITDITAWCNISFQLENSNPLSYAKHLYLNSEEITNLVIPNSVTSIGKYAFCLCSSLTSVTIPGSVTSIGYSAFQGCSNLTSITIPGSVTSIGNSAFSGCSGLTSVTIPNSVTSIGGYTFNNCSGLTSVTIGNSVTSIGDKAFYGCSILKEIYCLAEAVPTTETNTFSSPQNKTLHVPYNSISLYKSTQPWSDFKSIVGLYSHTLSYMINGSEYKSYNLWEGQTVTAEPAPQREGYVFSGWSEIPETMPDHDVIVTGTLTANSYTLTYKIDGEIYKTSTVACGTAITPEPAPTKEGYTFSGWKGLPTTMPAHDVTVTGSFSINSYTLTYKVDGEDYKTFSVAYGSALTPIAVPTRTGYTFSGWSELPATMPAHDVVVTGSFTAQTYTLTYKVDGDVYKTVSVAYGTTITPEPAPMREGYTFSGWNGLPTMMPDHDVTVTGTFYINYYSLTYKVDGSVYRTSRLAYGSTITPIAAPTMEGYTFSGWSEIPETMPAHDVVVTGSFTANASYYLFYVLDGSVYKAYSIRYGTTIVPESVPYKEGYTFSGWSGLPTIMPAHDVTVHGQYNINSYTLTYKVDGYVYKTFSVKYGSALTPEPVPVKKGMTFSGWSNMPETMPAHNVTITGTYSWSKETVDGVIYQVTDTLSNYASVIGTESMIAEATILPYVEIGGDIYEVYSIADNALPKTVTIYVSVGKLLMWLWTNGYEDIRETESGRSLAAPEVSLVTVTASSLTLSYVNQYSEFSETVMMSDSPIEKGENGYEVTLRGLEPNNLYEELVSLTLTYDEATYTKAFSFCTSPLTLATQQPKVVSLGNVVVAADSNLDDGETNVGFEWRRTDWTDDFLSKSGTAYLYEGMMEGYIRNLNTDKLWKYRPYYESNAGNRYYGEWIGIDPTDISYFDPTVHTYSTINLIGNTAEVMGYAMRGTDNITSQGFMYWNTGSASSRRNANGIPSDAKTVLASGNVMTATLDNLDYDTEYCYVAFVKTSEGETFYGEPQSFRTSPVDPDGISPIQTSPEKEEEWYDLNGRKLGKPQKGINIIRYSDGTTRKVLIK